MPNLVVGVAFLALAIVLLAVAPRSAGSRAFVVFFAFRGVNNVAEFLVRWPEEGVSFVGHVLLRTAYLATIAAMVYLVSVYPKRRGAWAGSRAFPWTLTVVVVALSVLVVTFSQRYAPLALAPEGHLAVAGMGWGALVIPMLNLTAWIIIVVLAVDYAREPEGPQRVTLLLIVVAFAMSAAFNAMLAVLYDVARTVAFPLGIGQRISWFTVETAILGVAAALAIVWRNARNEIERRRARIFALALVPPMLSAALVALLAPTPIPGAPGGSSIGASLLAGFWRLALPAVIVYALLKYRLFDIDLKLKWTIRRGTVAAIIVGVFFVATALAQNLLNERLGLVFGGVAAGVLLFAIHPLQHLAQRVADAALPGVRDTDEWRAGKKTESYKFAVRMALADSVLTRDEERGLADLAHELGLDYPTALRLREEVEREMGIAA